MGALADSNTNGGSAVLFDVTSGATLNFTFSNNVVTAARNTMLSATSHGGSHMDAIVIQNKLQNADIHMLSGSNGVLIQGGDNGAVDLTYNLSCNKISASIPGGAKAPRSTCSKPRTLYPGQCRARSVSMRSAFSARLFPARRTARQRSGYKDTASEPTPCLSKITPL